MEERRLSRGRPVRIGPWRGSDDVATLATYADHPLHPDDVDESLGLLASRGYQRVITAALAPREAAAFLGAGFEPLHHLVLLRRSLDLPLPRPDVRLRRWRRRTFDQILEVDRQAFDDFWQFDIVALRDALAATPHRSLRVTRDDPVEGYALSGVSAARGYLQRLAVRPDNHGQGLGTGLLLDALRWMRTRGALEAFVNTQHENQRAIDLYLGHGFDQEPNGLTIFQRTL